MTTGDELKAILERMEKRLDHLHDVVIGDGKGEERSLRDRVRDLEGGRGIKGKVLDVGALLLAAAIGAAGSIGTGLIAGGSCGVHAAEPDEP